MKITLTSEELKELEIAHRTMRDGRIRDRMKAVILRARGWSQVLIAEALLISADAVHDHLKDYANCKKLKPANGGSESKLSKKQANSLISHLEKNTYTKVSAICAHVYKTYKVKYTVSGMTKWLSNNNFSYKKPSCTPAKADLAKQEEFIESYLSLLESTPASEPILFADGVHPTMATKITYGWIRKGSDKPIATIASRTRINLMGAIALNAMNVICEAYKTLDSNAMEEFFKAVRAHYSDAIKIHLFVDQGPYNKSEQTRQAAKKYGIVLHYLPAYSPNLNPIERLWKIMNEYVRNNRVFASAKQFRHEIMEFFNTTWPQIANTMRGRINDNFQPLKQAASG